jgi:hypothetical protein
VRTCVPGLRAGEAKRGKAVCSGRREDVEKAEDTSSARQSQAQAQCISEQMASLVLTARNGQGSPCH